MLSWTFTNNDGEDFDHWVYRQKKGSVNYGFWKAIPGNTSVRMHTVTGLDNGSAYTFQIARGTTDNLPDPVSGNLAPFTTSVDPNSNEVTVTPAPVVAPAVPTGLTATAGDGQVMLSWTDPDDDSITGYKVRYSKTGTRRNASWTTISGSDADTTTHTVTGLDIGAEYSFKVRAVNSGGDGTATDWVTATPVLSLGSVTVSVSKLTVKEGSSTTFTMKLGTQPSDDVEASISQSALPILITTPGATGSTTLTFTDATWNVEQTVTVSASQDPDKIDNTGVLLIVLYSDDRSYSDLVVSSISITVLDDDKDGVTVSPAELTVDEGSSGTYTVQLATKPAANVTVTVGGTSLGEVSASPTSLTFNTGNWSTAQTVTVTAGSDSDTVDDTATLTHAASSSDTNYGSSLGIDDVEVTVTDTTPRGPLTITLTATAGDGQVTLSWTFTNDDGQSFQHWVYRQKKGTGNYSIWQRITGNTNVRAHTVTGLENDSAYTFMVARGETVVLITSQVDPESNEVTVTPMAPSVTVSKSELTVSEPNSGTYTVVLDTQPAGNVTVTPASNDMGAVTVSDALTFTRTNWDMAQSVTVKAVGDPDTNNESVMVTHTVSGYGSLRTASSVTVTVNDNAINAATPALAATPGNRQVRLKWKYTDTSHPTLLYNSWVYRQKEGAGAWSDWKDISGGKGIRNYTVTGLTNGAAYTFQVGRKGINLITSAEVILGPESNEAAATPAPPKPAKPRGLKAIAGNTQVVLSWTDPNDDSITGYQVQQRDGRRWGEWNSISGSDADTVAHIVTNLQNGSEYRFRIRAINDGGNSAQSATVTATPANVTPPTLTATAGVRGAVTLNWTVVDDAPGRLVANAVRLSVWQSRYRLKGNTNWATILHTQTNGASRTTSTNMSDIIPHGGIVEIQIQASGSAAGSSVSTTHGPWSNTATITLNDVDDNNTALKFTGAPVTVAPGEDSTYTIALTKPYAEGAVSIGSSTVSKATVSPASLTFTRSNYSVGQTVTVSGLEAGTVTINHAFRVTGASADAVPNAGTVAVMVTGNDPEDLTLSVSELTVVEEGSSGTYTVKLGTKPSSSVTVAVGGTSLGEVSASPTKLTFTTGNWNAAQTVTVSAGGDDDATDDTATLVNSAGSEYGSVSKNVAVTVTDNDEEGLTLSKTELTVDEEGSGVPYTVQLATKPAASVTVTVGGTSLGEVSASPTKLTFTTGNWNAAQTVAVTAGGDVDTADDTATLVNSAGSEYGSVSKNVAVTVDDNDTEGLTLSKSELTVAEEGSSVTYTVQLATKPAASVTVTVGGDSLGEVSASPTSLTFTTGNWSTAQTVTVSAGDDADAANDSATLVNSAGSEYGSVSKNVAVTVTDNDEEGLTLSKTELTVDEEGSGVPYTVQLATKPAASVTVTVGGTSLGEVSASPTKLTFTTGNWNAAQTVAVTAGGDVDTADDTATLVNSAGSEYGSVSKNVAVTVDDNDTEGLTLSKSELTVAEEGSSVTYTVQLATKPAASVTVTVGGDSLGEVSASPTSLTFTTGNWSTAQTVTVSAGDDADAANDSATLVNSAGSEYGSVSKNVAVTVTDNDEEGLTLSKSELTVDEEGSGVTYTVQLATKPSASVTVTVSGVSGEVSASPTSLTFTTGNWSTAQTVTVSAGGDDDATDDTATLVNSAGSEYGSVSKNVAVTVTDNDEESLTLSKSELTVDEEGSGVTYTVQLATKPAASVTVTVSGASGEVSALPTKLTFTTGNWNAAQTVTVTAGGDVDTADDTATLSNSAGSEYGSVSKNVAVKVDDNDNDGLTLSVSELTVNEDSSGTYAVKLNTLPTGSVTVSVGGDSLGEVSASPTSLTFTTGNWNAAQTVTVSAGGDDDANDDTATLVNSAGSEYGSVSKNVAVTVKDNDKEGLTLSKTELTVTEDGSGVTYTVQLATKPAASVTVTVGGTSLGEVSASPTKLTFTTDNWNAAQTVTVSAGGDDDANDETVMLSNSAGSEYGSVSKNVAVTVTDNDEEGLTLSVSELTVNEDSARTYTVKLDTLPSGSVTVTVSGASGEVSVSPTSLTFTTVNWNAEQTVTVTAGGDVNTVDDTATLSNSAGSEYSSVSKDLTVTVDDDDNDGLTLSASELTVNEDSARTYTVKLDTLPSGNVTVTVSGASGEVSAAPASLTFSTANWSAAQTVTVTAGGDDDAADDTATLVNSAGNEYGSVSEELAVTVDDDDTEGLTLSVSGLTIAEGGTGTYTVKLATLPAGSVTVTPASDATAVATVSGPLTFSTGNWSEAQTVTVTTEQDDDSVDGTAGVSHAVTGYGSVMTGGMVSVTVSDNDQLSTGLRKEHEGGVHELHVQFGQSMVGVANDIIVSRTSGTVSARQNSMLIAGRQILFGSPHPSAAPLPRAYTDQPLRLDGDVELTRQRVDSVVDLLSDSSFNVSSATGGSPGEGGLTLWGQGGKRSFKRNGAGRSLDGSVTVGGIGFEIPSEGWMGGLAYFRTRGKGNVTATSNGESVKSEERVTMNSVHPYVHWRASEQVELWGTLGYGTGRADSQLQQDDDSTEHRKGRMELLSALMGTRVSWDFDLAFKGEVAASRTTTKGLAAAPMRSNQQQYKAVVEWSRRQNLSAGGQLLPKVEAGVRYDDDSYSTGLSMVVAGSVRYTDADGRWSLEAGGSVLRSRTSKRYREKGVYVGVELRSEAGDTGPSMSIQATQGEMAEALQAAWTESAIDGSRSEREKSDGVGTQLEFGYGLALGSGHMKPKVSVLLPAEAGSKVYETGFEYWRGDRVSLELTHTHQPDTDRGDSIRLGGSLRW